jgi:hypothetical protein
LPVVSLALACAFTSGQSAGTEETKAEYIRLATVKFYIEKPAKAAY